jgi:hypothetical protein
MYWSLSFGGGLGCQSGDFLQLLPAPIVKEM